MGGRENARINSMKITESIIKEMVTGHKNDWIGQSKHGFVEGKLDFRNLLVLFLR